MRTVYIRSRQLGNAVNVYRVGVAVELLLGISTGRTTSDVHPQLDYGFASRPIAHRRTVGALNDTKARGPSDHCRIVIDLEET